MKILLSINHILNHYSTGVSAGVFTLKGMVRSQLGWFLWLDLGIPNNTSHVTRKICLQKCGVRSSPQNVVGHDSRRDRWWWSKISSFLKIFWGEIWRYLGQYLEFRHVWGLYTRLLDLTRAMRRKLVLFLTYKDLFVGIFVHRVHWNTSNQTLSRAVFKHNTPGWDGFLR